MSKTVRSKTKSGLSKIGKPTATLSSLSMLGKRTRKPSPLSQMTKNMSRLDDVLKSAGFTDLDLSRDVVKATTRDDPTFRGARLVGDSSKLAKARYDLGGKSQSFEDWKKGREAQHLIPATLHKSFPALKNIVDSQHNGMMLPTDQTYQNPSQSPVFQDASKRNKPVHRVGNERDHRRYTNTVKSFISEVKNLPGRSLNQNTLYTVMDSLRIAHRSIGTEQQTTNTKKYVNDIPLQTMRNSWNAVTKSKDF